MLCFAVCSLLGCEMSPNQTKDQGRSKAPVVLRTEPTPLPTRSVPSTGFDESKIPDSFAIQYSGPYWVQLNDRSTTGSSIVVGVDPTECGQDLAGALESYRTEMDKPPQSRFEESGTRETSTFGPVYWGRASFAEDDLTIEQIAIYAHHPSDACLVIARSEYREDSARFQDKLDELVRLASIIGPGI
jgi:hypothetical protein